ncbi:colanic acid biosynthesis pyruvyl transferase WcaK [Martelella alba]|uniref:Colanic acid biosynthesis pyruvyl transferase WcaK n=1 Tax=Martelella alba TaxID=2590451 RepID=A0ABY2SK86_9HYPH|nr:colanic acid biosynthesis pyruvyl transferase WcaK [Martelella alba]TKI05778.1 colanic acid biosynthesis pyruvyl transferase WcaK [Martelella alba]
MKLLLVGNHTCGNRGDGAILRGLISSIKSINAEIEIDVISRYPISSTYLLGRRVDKDFLFNSVKNNNKTIFRKIKSKIFENKDFYDLFDEVKKNRTFDKKTDISSIYKKLIEKMQDYDAIIQVGGSFFVDLYGVRQFEHALCAMAAKKPLFMIGHSVGPFTNEKFNHVADYVFENVNKLILRENISFELMKRSKISVSKVLEGTDTAWLVNPEDCERDDLRNNISPKLFNILSSGKAKIAITLRELAPFDIRLKVTQEQYEIAFANLVKKIIKLGYQVIAVSTCTGIESYNKDDRMVGLRIGDNINDENYYVVMDEVNDIQLGQILQFCKLTIGTRLHSAIISMNFGTPAIAINYEHKSLGILKNIGLEELSIDIKELIEGKLISHISNILDNISETKINICESVQKEKEKGVGIIKDIIKAIEILK